MVEIIDIYDANQLKIGSIDRNKAHEDGLWHKAFHCWIISEINNVNCLIFQLRSKNSSFPDLLDISAAGHFMKGETKKNVLREVNEELGIKLSFKNLNYLGQRIEVIDFGEIKNREFQDIFLIEIPDFVKLISPNNEEVNGIFWIPIEECIQLFSLEIKSSFSTITEHAPLIAVRGVRRSCETARRRLLRVFSRSDSILVFSCCLFWVIIVLVAIETTSMHITNTGYPDRVNFNSK